jgi:hypothetical protein
LGTWLASHFAVPIDNAGYDTDSVYCDDMLQPMLRFLGLLLVLPVQFLAAQVPAVRPQEQELIQHDDWWSIRVKYPQIDGKNGFNESVRLSVTEITKRFRGELPETATKGYPDYGAYLNGTYTATVLKNGIVSVLFDYDEYTPGAVHPWGILACVNYDTREHRALTLADLFRPGADYVSRLSELAIASLEQREYAEKVAIQHGAGPVADNFKVFTLTDTALVLHFQQYQVAPGAAPAQEVAIPLATLAPILGERYRPLR